MTTSCANTTYDQVPVGGAAQSARCSRVFFIPPDCTTGIKLDGTPPTDHSTEYWFSEQVTRIEIRSMVANRKYGHDKSFCWQDSCKGIRSCNGTLQTKVQCCDPPISFQSGTLMWIKVYPMGLSNGGVGDNVPCIQGYAEIEEDPIIMNLETGDPIEHNYTFASKGMWLMPRDIPTVTGGTFDCCGCCDGPVGSVEGPRNGGSFAPIERFSGVTQKPKTVYQWTDKGEWVVTLDECCGSFMPGPMPKEPGRFAGEMRFVDCQAA